MGRGSKIVRRKEARGTEPYPCPPFYLISQSLTGFCPASPAGTWQLQLDRGQGLNPVALPFGYGVHSSFCSSRAGCTPLLRKYRRPGWEGRGSYSHPRSLPPAPSEHATDATESQLSPRELPSPYTLIWRVFRGADRVPPRSHQHL